MIVHWREKGDAKMSDTKRRGSL